MIDNPEQWCCGQDDVDESAANRLQRDLSRLMRLFYVLSRDMVDALDITVLQGYILMGLQINGPMTMSGISDYSQLAASTITRVVDKLVKAGLTTRTYAEHDRRVIYLRLTPAGEARSTQFRALQNLFFRRLLSGLPDTERDSVLSGLATLTARLAYFTDQRPAVNDRSEDRLAIVEAALM